MKLFNNFFNGKKVLITGHTGFKGSWLSIWLNELGAKVIGYSLDPYTSNDNFVKAKLDEKITSIIGDIRNFQTLFDIFKKYKPEIVFHLAAQALVRASYADPKLTYDTNVGGTVNLLECIRKTESVKIGVIITSDKCYENKEWIWGYRENDSLGGYDPYSSSKACCELVVSAYNSSFFNTNDTKINNKSICTVRAGNVIGGGDWRSDRLITDCILALKKNEPIDIRNPNSIRPWQYVLDPLGGYLLLASKIENNKKLLGAWNFGPNNDSLIPVSNLVDKIIKIWGSGKWQNLSSDNFLHETKILKLDTSKAYTYLNWRPILTIDEAVKFTIDWYKQETPDYDFDVSQINEFISIANKRKINWIK
ncbi:MAG: CDP-glucose 4,6-dehydratase [Candidatus Helarchaeota archaeon]